MGFRSDSRTRLKDRRHRRTDAEAGCQEGDLGDPDAFLLNGKGGKVTAGVKALKDARASLEILRMKLRVAVVPFGAPQQPPQ
eukprot:5701398-Prymnesium_polylepis.1